MLYRKIINSLLCLLMIVSLGASSIVYAEEEDTSDITVSEVEEETLDEETSDDEESEGTKGSVIANTTTETVGDLSIKAKVIDIDILAEETLTDDEYNIVYYQGGTATYTITLADTPSDFFDYVEIGEPDFYDSFTISLTVTVTDVNDNVITDSRSISGTDQNTYTIYVFSKSLMVSESYDRNCHIMYFDNYKTNGDNGTSISYDEYDQPDGTLEFSINYFTDYAIYYTDVNEDEEDYENDDDYEDEDDETDNLTFTLSDGVLTISGNGAMANYSWDEACIDDIDSVTSIVIESGVTSIGNYAFNEAVNVTSVDIPDTVKSIGSGAFYNCTSLTSVTLPDSIKKISYWAFEGCTSLSSIDLSDNLTIIDEAIFEDCTSLETISIPKNVTSIEGGAFYGCKNLKTVTFEGDNLTEIGTYAFYKCSSLTSITIPASVDYIGSWAFLYCSSLEEFIVEDGNEYYSSYDGVLCDTSKTTMITYPGGKKDTSYTIPDSISSVEELAFAGCSYLEELTINETLNCYWYDEDWDEYIEEESRFEKCTSLKVVNINCESINYYDFRECENLTTVNIGENVENIDYGAFASCPNLTEVNIPKTVTEIDNYAFGTAYYTGSIGIGQQAKYAVTVYGYADSAAEKYVESANAELKENLEYDDELNSFLEFEGDWLTFVDLESSSTTELTDDNTTLSLSTSSYTYDGSAKKPTVTVKYGSTTLTKDTDYTVSYSNNTNVGTAKVTVAGIGNYTGTVTATYTITAKSISGATVKLKTTSFTYNGSSQSTSVSSVTLDGTTLSSSSDYSVSGTSGTSAGTYTVTVTGKGNYKGTATATYTISQYTLTSSTISLSSTSYSYNGSAKTPTITVKANSKTLTKGTDYTVSGTTSATNAGTYTVKITGKGNYTGTASKTFTISAASTSSATITLGYTSTTYTGSALKPGVTVKIGSNTISSSYYTVSYSSNTNAGTGKVTIKGKTNLSGSVTKSFTINARAISKATASSISNKTYTGSAIKPTVTLKYNGKTLTKGTDYTVKYSSNKSTGKATITITGIKNFTGTKKVYFYIVPKKVTISSAKSSKTKTITLKYKKATGASGYQIRYRKKGSSTWSYKTVSSGSTLSKTISGLKKKTNYQIGVRAYKTVSSKKYYGSWSTTKTVKTK